MTITPAQIKAARELLGWSRMKLAFRSETNFQRVSELERAGRSVSAEVHARLISALEAAGIAFAKRGAPYVTAKTDDAKSVTNQD